MKQQFLKDIAESFQTYVYEDNQIVIPISATITIYEPSTSTELISAQPMTVGSDGILSYDLSADNNEIANENYKAVIAYVIGSTTYYFTAFYDVVRSKLHAVITDIDIVTELPQLKENGWKTHGTASDGVTTTIIDMNLSIKEDDYFTGGLAYDIDQDETRKITNFVQATGTVTTEAFSGATAGNKYILSRSFTKEIRRGFEKIEQYFVNTGRRADLILDSYDIREPHIMYAVAEACKGLVAEEGGMWWEFMEKYDSKAYAILKNIKLKYDDSDDGVISQDEESKSFSITAGRN